MSDFQPWYTDTDTLGSAKQLHGDFTIYLVDPSMNGTKLRSTTPEEFQAGQAWQSHAKSSFGSLGHANVDWKYEIVYRCL